MDYLPIQASAVPCERVFSSSGETDTKKRNRTSPTLMEALQMLKFHLKKERLCFTTGLVTSQKDLVDNEPDEPVSGDISKDSLHDIIKIIGQEEADEVADEVEVVKLAI